MQEVKEAYLELNRIYRQHKVNYLRKHSKEEYQDHYYERLLENSKIVSALDQFLSFFQDGMSEWYLLNVVKNEDLQNLIINYLEEKDIPIIDKDCAYDYPEEWHNHSIFMPTFAKEEKMLSSNVEDAKKKRFFLENMPLIRNVCFCIPFPKEDTELYCDAFQWGSIGLWNAVLTFDPTMNVQFSTYAFPCIQREIWKGLGLEAEFVSTNKNRDYCRYLSFKTKYIKQVGVVPSLEEISSACYFSLKKARELEKLENFVISQEKIEDQIDEKQNIEDQLLLQESLSTLREAFQMLDQEEQTILINRYLKEQPMTFRSLESVYGCSYETIRSKEKKVLEKMRQKF